MREVGKLVDEKLDELELVRTTIQASISVKEAILGDERLLEEILEVGLGMVATIKSGGKVLFAGNGGSFADSMHLTAEFICRFQFDREPLPALCLGANCSNLTSISNDYSYGDVFVREIKALGRRGDYLLAISTSGNSENILRCVEVAQELGIKTMGLTGNEGGRLAKLTDCMVVPSPNTGRIQESHIMIGHLLCEIVENQLFLE